MEVVLSVADAKKRFGTAQALSSGTGPGALKIIGVDLDRTEVSRKFLAALADQDALEIVAPQIAVLGAMSVVFLAIARVLARRWETV